MKVKLIDYQPNALDILLYTKKTRLAAEMCLEDMARLPYEEKMDELAYMKDTIHSSWEFVRYVFEISEVTRAFTHQFVRTRTQSYAQESHRTVDIKDNKWLTPNTDIHLMDLFDNAMEASLSAYSTLVRQGMTRSNARGIIPTNIHTSIMVATNLRILHDTAETRLCKRTQGEYQEVFKLMKDEIVKVHPWTEDMIQVFCANHGTCCFPRFTECPIQKHTITGDALDIIKRSVKREHSKTKFEANPQITKPGRTD